MVFASFAINSMIYIFAYRSMRRPIWQMVALRENKALVWTILAGLATALIAFLIPGLREILGIVPLSLAEWGVIAGVALFLLSIVEVAKIVANKYHAND